jgi:ABC-2 type transport system permease protein
MNTHVLETNDLSPPSVGRTLGAYWQEIRCEALRMMRNPGIAIPVFLLPTGLYALFAMLIAGEAIDKDPNTGIFLFTAFSVMATSMPALFGIGASLAMERDMGLMRLKRVQPAPAGSWLVAKIVCGIGFGILSYAPIATLAVLAGKLALSSGAILALSGVLIGSSIPFCAMGLMIGALVKGSAAPGFANLVYLPGCYLSGLFFPLKESMYWQAPIWPQFHVQQLAMHVSGMTKFPLEPVMVAVATLVGYTALFSAVAIWRLARKG